MTDKESKLPSFSSSSSPVGAQVSSQMQMTTSSSAIGLSALDKMMLQSPPAAASVSSLSSTSARGVSAFEQMLSTQEQHTLSAVPSAASVPSRQNTPLPDVRTFKLLSDQAKYIRAEWLTNDKWISRRKQASAIPLTRETSESDAKIDKEINREWALACAANEFAHAHSLFRNKHQRLFDRIIGMHDVLENHCKNDQERANVMAREDEFYKVLDDAIEAKRQGVPYNRQASAQRLLNLNCPELSVELDKFLINNRARLVNACQDALRNKTFKKHGRRLCAAGQVQADLTVTNWNVMTIDDCRKLIKSVQAAKTKAADELLPSSTTKAPATDRSGEAKVETKEEWNFEDFAKDASECDYLSWFPMLVMYNDGTVRHLVVQYPWKRDTGAFVQQKQGKQ